LNRAYTFLGVPGPQYDDAFNSIINTVPTSEVIDLCRELFRAEPKMAHHIVWLAFWDASIDQDTLTLGPVQLWDSELVFQIVDSQTFVRSNIPGELKDSFITSNQFPNDRGCVLFRVDLGQVAHNDAVPLANAQADALVSLGAFRSNKRRWRQSGGHIHLVDDWISSMAGFQEIPSKYHPGYDPIGYEIANFGDDITSHLPLSNPEILKVLETVRWWSNAAGQPPEVRVLLDVRLLETAYEKIGANKWYDYLTEFHKLHWIWRMLLSDLDPVLRIVDSYLAYPEPEYSILTSWLLRIRQRSDGPQYTIHFDEAYRAIDDVSAIVSGNTLDGRDIRGLTKHWSSSENLMSRFAKYEDEWSSLYERLIRFRNALTHGGPITHASADSVVEFSASLSAWTVSLTIEAALTGRSVKQAHDDHAARIGKRIDKLRTAPTVIDALFID
jgi:hypothetical protein